MVKSYPTYFRECDHEDCSVSTGSWLTEKEVPKVPKGWCYDKVTGKVFCSLPHVAHTLQGELS
jgi:hypothetical protein